MHMVDDVGGEGNPCTNEGKGGLVSGCQWTRIFWAEESQGEGLDDTVDWS